MRLEWDHSVSWCTAIPLVDEVCKGPRVHQYKDPAHARLFPADWTYISDHKTEMNILGELWAFMKVRKKR